MELPPSSLAEQKRLSSLDGVRGTAILLVLTWHFVYPFVVPESSNLSKTLLPFASLTWSGVDLFFVLSGFLLGGQLIDNRRSPHYFRTFYIRRACRILPLYFIWLSISESVNAFAPFRRFPWLLFPFHDPFPLLTSLTFTQNFYLAHQNAFLGGGDWFAATWSLAIEEQFYLVLPFVIRRSPTRWLPYVLIGFIVLAPVSRFFFSGLSQFFIPICRFDALFLGVLSAWAIRTPEVRDHLTKKRRPLGYLVCIIGLGILVLAWREHYSFYSSVMMHFGLSLIALFYALLITLLAMSPKGRMHQVFSMAPLRNLGLISYGIFLVHRGVAALVGGLLLQRSLPTLSWEGAVLTLLSAGLSICVACVSYLWLELPFRRFGLRFRY